MKKIIPLILFFLLPVSFVEASITQYEESVKTDSNFSEFGLLEEYLANHKKKLVLFQQKYEIYNNKDFDFYISEIQKLENLSANIYKNKKIDYDRKIVWEEIVKKIKYINTQLREILIEEKKKFEENLQKKHKAYSKVSEQIWDNIYKKIENQVNKIKQSNLSKENKLKIVIHLRNLEKNALELKNFKNMKFKNLEEMSQKFNNIFKEIRKDLQEINNLLQ